VPLRSRTWRWSSVAAAALAAVALAVPASSQAALPGRNGVLVHQGASSRDGTLYLRRSDGSGLRRLKFGGSVANPVFSPQGQRLAFATLGQVWVAFADGSTPRPVTVGPGPSGNPTWSPAGDALAFAHGATGARDVYSIGADGNGLRALTSNRADEHSPSWSAGGEIAFVQRTPRRGRGKHTRRANGDVYAMAADGTAQRALTRSPLEDGSPAWSPDGRRIAFTRSARERKEIYVMTRTGHGLRRLTDRGDVDAPAWSPDGRWIVFSAGHGDRHALFVMRSRGGTPYRVTSFTADARVPDWQPLGGDPVIAAAGDIACDPAGPRFNDGLGTTGRCRQRATSDILLRRDLAAVLALGDLQYEDGQLWKFLQSFDTSWGRARGIMHPVPGNHEYRTPDAAGYFDYFNGVGNATGPAGPRGAGYYSFDVGTWHFIALNSECADGAALASACAAGSPQEQWLRADLAGHPAACTLAFFHHPLASSGIGVVETAMQPIYQALYDGQVDVVLTGHDHAYERFAPQTPALQADPVRGIRAFVIGTGGKSFTETLLPQPNSELRGLAYGVLELTLHPGSYDWTFVPDTPGGFTDSGSAACH
jgi:hypothetical protein